MWDLFKMIYLSAESTYLHKNTAEINEVVDTQILHGRLVGMTVFCVV